jgi:hypothetical protein
MYSSSIRLLGVGEVDEAAQGPSLLGIKYKESPIDCMVQPAEMRNNSADVGKAELGNAVRCSQGS